MNKELIEKAIKLYRESNDLTEKICEVIKDTGYNIDVLHVTLKGLLSACEKEMEERNNG